MYQSSTITSSIIILMQLIQSIIADIAILDAQNKSVELFIDYKISYTPPIPNDGIYGALTFASPADACKPIEPPPSSPWPFNMTMNWFVLAYRSSSFHSVCSNREKIQHAVNAGYKAIILYSPMDYYQTSVIFTPFEHTNITIPAVLVSHEDGEQLRQNFLYNFNYYLFITSEMPPNFTYYLIPFAIIIGAGILITIAYVIFQLMMCIMERRKAQRHRLSRKDLKKVTLQKFEKGIFYETCAICLDDYVEGEKIRILPCNHAYHQKCIDPWLTKNRRVCPVCKAKVKLPGMAEYSDSDSDNDHNNTSHNNNNNFYSNSLIMIIPNNDNQQHQQQQEPNERTQLLPSTSATSSASTMNRLLSSINQSSASASAAAGLPSSSTTTSTAAAAEAHRSNVDLEQLFRSFMFRTPSSSSRRNRYTNLREILDDQTLPMPSTSTSAPIISADITSSSNYNNSNRTQLQPQQQQQSRRTINQTAPLVSNRLNNSHQNTNQNNNRRNKRRNQRNQQQQQQQQQSQLSSSSSENQQQVPSIHTVIADLHTTTAASDHRNNGDNGQQSSSSSSLSSSAPTTTNNHLLIAPKQLSINCDSSDEKLNDDNVLIIEDNNKKKEGQRSSSHEIV